MCVRLAREGCSRVTCLDVDLEGARETARLVEAAGGRAGHAKCDVTRRDQLASLLSSLPPVDVLINNAGIVSGAPILQVTDEQIDNMIGVNLMAHFHTIRAVLPSMLKRGGGHIVGISSAAAFTAAANIAPYAATKYAVTGMMYSLREEMRKFHPEIKVTSVHPFFISPPPHCLEHWQKKSRIPDVSATEVADKTVEGIKRNKATVVVPSYLYHLLVLLM
ncbi:hypothetical protein AAG570_005494 [Ranatra chinensis]|uniref:Uncharacterized protein n=1 Tax=Ranatra chinensis TaxID=642074 RepID=A0ABD0YFZ3_9HEMI